MKTKIRKFLSMALAVTIVLCSAPTSVQAEENTPALPTATVTEIENENLTFALNFKADEVTADQLAYYGTWPADFVLTLNKTVTFNADGTADGYLSGQYDAWSENWVNVPFEDATLAANTPLKIMEYAMELMGYSTKLTYGDVYEGVKDFNCGVFFTEEFLAANPDLEVNLELRMYNPADETESYVVGEPYEFEVTPPELPTATVTELESEDLTFALNFKADEVTTSQLAYYGDWYADFVLTLNQDVTFNANGGADGYLSGQYDEWSENWVNVPFDDVTLKAGESLKIMEYAAAMMGEAGLKVTYNDVYTSVQDFDCGVFFEPEFLAALEEDLLVTLELRMYNPADESESYVIGETYMYDYATMPTATVTEIENDDLTIALNFKADEATEAQLRTYGNWYADFVLTINKDVTLNADGSADGYLSGQYDVWSENWVNVPFENVTLKADESLKIMEYAAKMMGETGLKVTYNDVYTSVKDFDCGVYFDQEFLAANPGLEVTLELRMFNPKNENESYVIGDTYKFNCVAQNTVTEKVYEDVAEALLAAGEGETVVMLKDAESFEVLVPGGVTLDLKGRNLTGNYVSAFGNIKDSSADKGVLKVAANHILIRDDNTQLPVKSGEGYQFFETKLIQQRYAENLSKYGFQINFDEGLHTKLLEGKAATGVTVNVKVSWAQANGLRSQIFEYNDEMVTQYINSYDETTDKYTGMFALTLTGTDGFENLTFEAVVVSDTGVELAFGEVSGQTTVNK